MKTEIGGRGHSGSMTVAAPAVRGELGEAPAVPAFDDIYDRHFDFVWRSLRRLGVEPAALDDAAQEVFLVVHRRLTEFEGRSSLKTWLFSIALHVAQHHARSHARRRTDPLPEEVTGSYAEITPHDEAARREAISLLYAILDELEPAKRAVFVMAELEQFTAPEIAQATGTPLNSVYSRLRAARQDFEASLKRRQARERWRQP